MAREVTVRGTGATLEQRIEVGPHRLTADEPESAGGEDLGPAPHELLLSALGTCTSMTLKIYADRKGWPLEGVQVTLNLSRVPGGEGEPPRTLIDRRIELSGPLDEAQRARLLEIADKCPVHRTLVRPIDVVTALG